MISYADKGKFKSDRVLLPRDSQSDVHLSSAGKVEGVEGHLSGGLADGLSCQQTHSFTRVTQRTLPLIVQQLPEAEDREIIDFTSGKKNGLI